MQSVGARAVDRSPPSVRQPAAQGGALNWLRAMRGDPCGREGSAAVIVAWVGTVTYVGLDTGVCAAQSGATA
jgi:hypothetical protein